MRALLHARPYYSGLRLRLLPILVLASCGAPAPGGSAFMAAPGGTPESGGEQPALTLLEEQVLRGRYLVIAHGCGDCHGGGPVPSGTRWLSGSTAADEPFPVGEYHVWPANLTPDRETGLGRYTDRQIFNAMRYGLRPSETPDVEITSATPGTGNHPTRPNYLAPVMPWQAFRHHSDDDLLAMIAYLRHVEPVRNEPPEGVRPPDFWAGEFTVEWIGPRPAAPFPTANEELRDATRREQVLLGRDIVISVACGDCHGGRSDPSAAGWLAGLLPAGQRERAGPYEMEFPIGPFATRPRNLTPDNSTGLGRFSERQIFNAIRYGLRPGETADVEITSTVPGEGNHPPHPKYLAPPMPWPAWRHLSDDDLWAVVAYLKNGLKPVSNRVADSEGPPDFWASEYTVEKYGPYPAPPFPTRHERRPAQRH
jgi:mono/diheme cytochrome c family protein